MNPDARGFWRLAASLAVTLLVVISAGIVFASTATTSPSASPASDSPADNPAADSAVIALPLEFAPGLPGLALIDTQRQTICLYEYSPRAVAHERFALVAARSYRYDRLLEDYNNADPTPATVRQWVERAALLQQPARHAAYQSLPDANQPAPTPTTLAQPTSLPQDLTDTHTDTPETTVSAPANTAANVPAIAHDEVIQLACGASDCDFSIRLPGESFLAAAREQIAQVQARQPERYQRYLQVARELAGPQASDSQVLDTLANAWGDAQRQLPFTCPRCGRDTVYRAHLCPQCNQTFLRPEQTDSGPQCPHCHAPLTPKTENP